MGPKKNSHTRLRNGLLLSFVVAIALSVLPPTTAKRQGGSNSVELATLPRKLHTTSPDVPSLGIPLDDQLIHLLNSDSLSHNKGENSVDSAAEQNRPNQEQEERDGPDVIRDRVRDYLRRHGLDKGFDLNKRLQKVRQEYGKQEKEKAARLLKAEAIPGTNWVSLGPTNGAGRMTAIAAHPTVSGTIYVGAAGGGLWKTTDGGTSWISVTDSINDLFVGAVAIAPSSPNTIYLGTGEGNTFTPGIGILKSFDGGSTWQFPSSVLAQSFYKISVHPTNPQELVVGAIFSGYRSTNGGQTWTKVISSGSVTDIARDPANPQVLYATTRGATQILKSIDGGVTWTNKSSGIPVQALDRLSIAVSSSNPQILYTAGASSDNVAHIYKTVNGGDSWSETALSTTPNLNNFFKSLGDQSSYDNTITVSPTDSNLVIVGGVSYVKTVDGGANWISPFGSGGYPHVDVHDLQYQGSTLYIANDGGIWSSSDNGQSGTDRNTGLVTRQYYTVANNPINRNRIFGGTQDNGTNRRGDSGGTNWDSVLGGDGFDCVVNPYAPEVSYATIQGGEIHRTKSSSTTVYLTEEITPPYPSGDFRAFATVLTLDSNNPSILYTGSTRVWKSVDGGDSWSTLPKTTTDGSSWPNDASGTIFKIAIAPSDSRILMISTGAGVFRSTNNGTTWVRVLSNSVNCIEIDSKNPSVIYLAQPSGSISVSTDGGASWISRGSGLPSFSIHVVRIDPTDSNVLFCGTDVGVYKSTDKGLNWTKFGTGLPSVSVYDLRILSDGSAVRAATHGRGMWELQIPSSGNNPPSAAINLPTSNLLVKGSSVNFQGVTSDPDSGDSATGTWYFADTGEVINSGSGTISTTHIFSRAGPFAVSLTAKDSHGTLGQSARTFFVLNDSPQNCAASTPCVPVPSGLVAWWRAEGDAKDETGANNGTLANDMSFGQGRVCAGFSGDGNGAFKPKKSIVADSASLALTQSLTIEGWISLNVVDPGGGYTLLERGEKTYDNNIWGAYSLLTNSGRLLFTITPNSSGNPNTVFLSSSTTIPAGQFVHVAATLDNATGQMKLYQNGVLVSQLTTASRPYGDLSLGQNSISIGSIPPDNIGSSINRDLNGVIDEISIYNRALTASEIQAIYNAGIATNGAAGKCPLAPAPLRIDSVVARAGRTSGGQQIRLTGAFAALSNVTMGGATATWSYTNGPSDTSSITVTTPPHAVGAVQIDLTPTSGSVNSMPNAFAYLPTVFTDNTIFAAVTIARAQHIIELRQAVDALRAVAGLAPAPWTDPTLSPTSTIIKAVHILELRTYLDDAVSRLGYPTSPYTDPSLGTGLMIKRVHIEELRERIRAIAG